MLMVVRSGAACRSYIWDKLDHGGFVSDLYLDTASGGVCSAIPRC